MIARPPTTTRVTAMLPEHAEAVAAIEDVDGPAGWDAEVFRAELAKADRAYVVALDGPGAFADVVGYGGIIVAAGEAHLLTVAVRADRRRRGTGRQLVTALLDAAVQRGAEAMTLEVRVSNTAALAMYAQLGFASDGVRPGYYRDGEDAAILWLRDLRSVTDLGS